MQFIALLPANSPQAISPTDISQFIRLDQCRRYLRLRLHERTCGSRFMRDYDVVPQAIPPLLSQAGASFEAMVEGTLDALARSLPTVQVVRCTRQEDDEPGYDDNTLLVELARSLAPGGVIFLLQPRLRVTLASWQLRGDADIVRLERGSTGELDILVVDSKSSTSARVEHRLQVAFYHEMLEALLGRAGIPATIRTAILYRGPAAGAAPLTGAEATRQAGEREQAQRLFGVAEGLLEIVAEPESYRDAVRDLVLDSDSTASQVARADFAAIPFHLSYKCDGCLYNEFCMKWSAQHDDLSLLPHLTDHDKRVLNNHGLRTTVDLASLKTFRAPESVELIATPGRQQQVRVLSSAWPVGPRLDELVHRARRYREWTGDQMRALRVIPSKGYGSLPYCAADHNPNLVRVYIDAQHDYLHDRVYLLGALIVACENGVEQAQHRRSLVQITAQPPADAAQERDLLVNWLGATMRAIGELAAADAEGRPRAPIHLIFFNAFEQRLLLDALARHFMAIAGATPLYDFVTQLAAFDSPVATFLDQEMRELKNYPLVCQSLQAVAEHLGFDWDTPLPLRTIFRTRMFDQRGVLEPGTTAVKVEPALAEPHAAEQPTAVAEVWYTARARFGSQIPLEYAYAAWGQLPIAEAPDPFASYREATLELLHRFQTRRLEALERIARDFVGNRQTRKSSFDLAAISSFMQKARTLAEALDEFVTIERHVELAAWKSARLAPPERRALAGATLIVRYFAADQEPEIAQENALNEQRRQLHEQYRAAYRANNPNARQVRLPKEQKAASDWSSQDGLTVRLRLDVEDLDCDTATLLDLCDLREGELLVLAPRLTVDESLPPAERQFFTPTPKQLLYAARALLLAIDRDHGLLTVELRRGRGSTTSRGFTFPTMENMFRPLVDGERYTLDADPNNWYGLYCARVVEGLQAGEPNTLYSRLADPRSEHVSWSEAALAGQARFMAGLDALREGGLLHAFDQHQRAFIEYHGDTPTLLVQGPPGTGKSYTTAFALLARMQGALAAGRDFRALLSCKTHAATNVLLQKLAEAQQLLAKKREQAPVLFAAFFDARLLEVPLFRVSPKDKPPQDSLALDKGEALARLQLAPHCFAAITPGAVYGMLKESGLFGQQCCDCLVLDEASQMNLPEAAMAALPLRSDGQLIVVGDHRQMPPIVHHSWGNERRRTFQQYRVYESLFVTLLEREAAPPLVKFAESFRLHAAMAEFLRREIYAQDQIDYHSRKRDLLPAKALDNPFVAQVLAPDYPLVVVVHDEAASQVRNSFEQQLMAPLLEALLGAAGHHLNPRTGLGVVVPHRAQRADLQVLLKRLVNDPAQAVESAVDTVERFQGGERDVIVISATESDADYLRSAGEFLLDPRRLTVALSRAKQKLVLVAARSVFSVFNPDEEVFANAQLWKNLLRRTCSELLWQGQHDGVRVEVWGQRDAVTSSAEE